ncbi:Rad9-domain-containing protein [Lactarius sanguifluus]|nr:Rad9-domain-containing protein [Lactarius sanguifluus]
MSKYSDELFINAISNSVTFSATNASQSAYCRFTYDRSFFTRFNVGDRSMRDALPDMDDMERIQSASGQLCVQPLLTILKHKTLEKTLDRLDLIIVDGEPIDGDEDHDSLEGKLIVRLHCKHGIVKTHRLLLQTQSSQLHLHVPEALNESHVVIGPKAIREMIDHFSSTRGKADPQLTWVFDDTEVYVRSLENSLDSKGGQLSTELTISADEFENYDIFATPISLAFHLREFNATIAYAESMAAILDVRFTDPTAALYVDVLSDGIEGLFAMSTSRVPGAPAPPTRGALHVSASREEDAASRHRTPAKVVERVETTRSTRQASEAQQPTPSHASAGRPHSPPPHNSPEVPLFLPGSQMTAADQEALHASGLHGMDADEFNAMMEDEGEEVGLNLGPSDVIAPSPPMPPDLDPGEQGRGQDVDWLDDDIESAMGPTQSDESGRAFRPLFDD